MLLSESQLDNLLCAIANVETDELSCDECFARIAECVDSQNGLARTPADLLLVQVHLKECACCAEEYDVLLVGIAAIPV